MFIPTSTGKGGFKIREFQTTETKIFLSSALVPMLGNPQNKRAHSTCAPIRTLLTTCCMPFVKGAVDVDILCTSVDVYSAGLTTV